MTHPHGVMTYVPGGRFAFPRSYITQLRIATNHVNVPSYADGLITWRHEPPDAVTGETKLKDVLIPWNSNAYTLDFVVEWWFFKIAPSPVEIEWGGEVSFEWNPTVKAHCLVIATAAADMNYFYPLAPAPSDYWLAEYR
jgi:hypothetical protein